MSGKESSKDVFCDFNCESFDDNYYKAYDKRYRQVYEYDYLWSSKSPTPDVFETIKKYNIPVSASILDLGCGEGRDSIFLLDKGYNVLAVDYSDTVIEKCRELSQNKYNSKFRQFDIMSDVMDEKFDFIYSIAVIHMFVSEKHRNKFYSFIYDHLKDGGVALIVSMGDGKKVYESDIKNSFNDVERVVLNKDEKINIAATSCRIVDWDFFESELLNNNLVIKEKWVSENVPEFNSMMCVVVSRG